MPRQCGSRDHGCNFYIGNTVSVHRGDIVTVNWRGFISVWQHEGQILPTRGILVSAGSLNHAPCPFKLFCLPSDIQVNSACIIKATRRFYYRLEKAKRGSVQSLSWVVELGASLVLFHHLSSEGVKLSDLVS